MDEPSTDTLITVAAGALPSSPASCARRAARGAATRRRGRGVDPARAPRGRAAARGHARARARARPQLVHRPQFASGCGFRPLAAALEPLVPADRAAAMVVVAARPSAVAVEHHSNNHRIQKFDASGAFLTTWGSWGSGNGQVSEPRGVATDGSGNVYVADTGNHRIQKFDCSTTPTTSTTS